MLRLAAEPSDLSPEVLVIGGGIVGVSVALELAASGRQVTLCEAGDICAGASYGNAGFILYSHIIPLAAPGALGQGLRWLLDSTSPFYIKPRFSLDLLRWLWRFRAACNDDAVRSGMAILAQLSQISKNRYDALDEAGILQAAYQCKGHLKLYCTQKGFDKGAAEAAWEAPFGVESQLLTPTDIGSMIPAASAEIVGGIYYPQDAHVIPDQLVKKLADAAQVSGVDIREQAEVLGFETDGDRIAGVITRRGVARPGQIVLAGGSWSPAIVRDLKLHLPIQGAKGYSLTYRRDGGFADMPLLLKEASVAVTPMNGKLRIAGTLELAGADFSVNFRRINGFLGKISRYISGVEGLELLEIWRGLRPCTPDGLPIIGRVKRYKNLVLATGHAMVGMALGPATGMLVSHIINGTDPGLDISRLSLSRFSAE
jgi:D-amino-acid dehydrogenase